MKAKEAAIFSRQPSKGFNRLYVSMVRAGEIGGMLDSALLRMATTMEKQIELSARSSRP